MPYRHIPPWQAGALAVVGAVARQLDGEGLAQAVVADERLSAELAQPDVVQCAVRHKVVGDVLTAARAVSPDSDVADRLAGVARRQALMSLGQASKTRQVWDALSDAGCRPLAIKGVVLAAQTTGNVGSRGPGDIDVVVAPHRLRAAVQMLQRMGMRPLVSSEHTAFMHAVTLEGDWGSVDLHHRFDKYPGVGVDPDVLWERGEDVALGDGVVRTLNRADASVFAAITGGNDIWSQLVRITDFLRLSQGISETHLDRVADQWRATPMMRLARAMCRRLTPRIPRQDWVVESVARQAWFWIAEDRQLRLEQDRRTKLERELFRLAAMRQSAHLRWVVERNLRRPWDPAVYGYPA